jgi:hypothetical protein
LTKADFKGDAMNPSPVNQIATTAGAPPSLAHRHAAEYRRIRRANRRRVSPLLVAASEGRKRLTARHA